MMRSLYSGVAGLRTHQTKMDVIGNNIANVNTTAYKSQSMTFSDLLYQTTQSATGANASTGRGGTNARQIGLGSKTSAISTAITTQGSAQTTNNPFDIMITGDSFFIVSDGSQNFFTRDGSFTVDAAGNLVMSSTGYKVMGWQTDENGNILADTVSALKITTADNLTYPAESTTAAYVSGIIDSTATALSSTAGHIMTLTFYDQQGYQYTARFSVHSTGTDGQYRVALDDILGTGDDGQIYSLLDIYGLSDISQIASFGSMDNTITTTEKYSLASNAAYENGVYYLTYSADTVLSAFSSNALIAASSAYTIELDDGDTVSEGDAVTVTGSVTLTKDQLEQEPYSLLFDSEDTDNNGVTTTSYFYLYGTTQLTTATANDTAALAAWEDALGVTGLTAVTVSDDGEVEFSYESSFTATMDCVYDADTKQFRVEIDQDDEEAILAAYGLEETSDVTYSIVTVASDGTAQITKVENAPGSTLYLNTTDGTFQGIGSNSASSTTAVLNFNTSATTLSGTTIDLSRFTDISIDFSKIYSSNNGGSCTAGMTPGDIDGYYAGRTYGEMTGVQIGQDGIITASYDNGQTKILGQIAVANFANASGLAKAGDNLYSATVNSGEFDGIGDDITSNGGYMTSGMLEMSNVDLSQEFTEMITTQRGFQANSRIITVSDTLLEELVNLKR